MKERPVVAAEHDLAWPAPFDAERIAIGAALADAAIKMHHIASTAVEGL